MNPVTVFVVSLVSVVAFFTVASVNFSRAARDPDVMFQRNWWLIHSLTGMFTTLAAISAAVSGAMALYLNLR